MFFPNTTTSTDDRNENSVGVNQDDEFYQRLLSRESSGGTELSFRVLYYGVTPVAIPFDWESQPGKPKKEDVVPAKTIVNPPLTPPPSYRSQTCSSTVKTNGVEKVSNSSSFFLTVLRGLQLNKKKKKKSENERVRSLSTSPLTPSDSPSSSFSSSSSSMLSPMIRPRHRRSYSTSCLRLGHKGSEEESAVSDSCFWKKGR